MIRFAKCFAMAGEMADLRMALFEVAWTRSKNGFRVGSPSEEAQLYRHQCARWYITGKGHWVRQVTLELLPVGDWRDRTNVQIWLPTLEGVDLDATRVAVCNRLVRGLVPHRFRMHDRQTWHGQEEAISDIAIIDCCHGLLEPMFTVYAVKRVAKGVLSNTRLLDLAKQACDGGDDGRAAGMLLDEIVEKEGGESAAVASGDGEFQRRMAIDIQMARNWLATRQPRPSTQMNLLRTSITALQYLLRQLRWVGSKDWEREQTARAARGQPLRPGSQLTRDFRVLVAARGDLENDCQRRLWAAMSLDALWAIIDSHDTTVRTRSLAFVMIPKAMALV
jgi:hypothetical protein